MKPYIPEEAIHVEGIKLWSHVGVLETERINGQYFDLNFSIWLDLEAASKSDDLNLTLDYVVGIKELQRFALEFNCLTIEHFSEKILDCLESIYGNYPIKILLAKCDPPIAGFGGRVAVERVRNFPELVL